MLNLVAFPPSGCETDRDLCPSCNVHVFNIALLAPRVTVHEMRRPLSKSQRLAVGDLLRHVFVMLRILGNRYFWTPERCRAGNLAGIRYAFGRVGYQ